MKLSKFFIGRAVVLLVLLLIAGAIYPFIKTKEGREAPATTFEECVAEGNPVMESYPRQCRSKAGQNFTEHIANTDMSDKTLSLKTWNWANIVNADGSIVLPRIPNVFTLKFTGPETFIISTDCNSGQGEYTVMNGTISIGPIVSTEMACENSQEAEFKTALEQADLYNFTPDGELVFKLESNKGYIIFR